MSRSQKTIVLAYCRCGAVFEAGRSPLAGLPVESCPVCKRIGKPWKVVEVPKEYWRRTPWRR